MNNSLKKFTRFAVTALIIGVVAVCFVLRFAFDRISGLIALGADRNDPIISVTPDGVNIADLIVVDKTGVEVGGIRVDFNEVGSSVSEGLEDAGIVVTDGMAGNLSDVTEAGFTQNRYTFPADINRALDIEVANCDVVIAAGDSDSIVVDVFESDEFGYKMSTQDNTLVIRDGAEAVEEKYLNIFGYKLSLGATEKQTTYTGLGMVIYLPADFCGELKLVTSGGDVKLGNLKLDESLTVVTSGANAELTNIEAYDISVRTTGGRVILRELSATEISASTTKARITAEELTSKRLELTTSEASIDFSRVFGEKFTFTTSGGDISGSILGQEVLFSIVTETDRTAFPKTSENDRAQYRLTAKTSGGDINIRFVE